MALNPPKVRNVLFTPELTFPMYGVRHGIYILEVLNPLYSVQYHDAMSTTTCVALDCIVSTISDQKGKPGSPVTIIMPINVNSILDLANAMSNTTIENRIVLHVSTRRKQASIEPHYTYEFVGWGAKTKIKIRSDAVFEKWRERRILFGKRKANPAEMGIGRDFAIEYLMQKKNDEKN